MKSPSQAGLTFEGRIAFIAAAVATAVCVKNEWFDHIRMVLRREERYELDEYIGGCVVFLIVAVIMFVRRDWQLRQELTISAALAQDAYIVARHDHLTKIPNRLALIERMLSCVDARIVMLLIDLDGFKAINDHHGHAAGDEVLKEVARRLMAIRTNEQDAYVARLGGDEFAFMLPFVSEAEVRDIMKRITRDLQRSIDLPTGTVNVGASIGSATSDVGGFDPDELLRGADIAMYCSKHIRQAPRSRPSA